MGKVNSLIYTILLFGCFSCNSQKSNMMEENDYASNVQIEEKLLEIAHAYVRALNVDTSYKELFCIYITRENNKSKNFYLYQIHDSGILNENLDLPYKYVNKEAQESFVVFFFDAQRKVPRNIKKKLEEDSLWTSLSNIDKIKKNRPVIKMSASHVWDVFICKNDKNKYEIIQSIYGLEEEERFTDICD
jgi:hypothetical protein